MYVNTIRPTVNTCKKSSYRLLYRFLRLYFVELLGSISGECPEVVLRHCSRKFFPFTFVSYCDILIKMFTMFIANQTTAIREEIQMGMKEVDL